MNHLFPAMALTLVFLLPATALGSDTGPVSEVKVTTLSTMLTEFRGVGEWGYAALVEVDGRKIHLG